jgi:type IV secretory pathway VirB3-like protein
MWLAKMVVVVVLAVVAAAVLVVVAVVVVLVVVVAVVVNRYALFLSDHLQVSLVLFFILRYCIKHLRNKQFRGIECC